MALLKVLLGSYLQHQKKKKQRAIKVWPPSDKKNLLDLHMSRDIKNGSSQVYSIKLYM